jgi:hypothetical protein
MVQRAIDCCSRLNHWALAVDLAREHGMQAENLLESRASQLRQHGRKVDEVNLFKKAEAHHRSAQVLVDLAKRAVVRHQSHVATPRPASIVLLTLVQDSDVRTFTGDCDDTASIRRSYRSVELEVGFHT